MTIQTDTVTLPESWASALVNGDFSGLDEAETTHCKAAIERLGEWYVVALGEEAPRFTWHYQVYDPLADCHGGHVVDYIIHRRASC